MTNQELVAIRLLKGQSLGIQIQKFYQIIEASNAAELLDMKTYVQHMMEVKAKDETFFPMLKQMNTMIDGKLK